MAPAKKLKPIDRETFRIPRQATEGMNRLVADVRKAGGVALRKTYIIVGLLGLLDETEIDPKAIRSESDLIDQVRRQMRKGK
jgi:hypothetical protein